MTWWHPACLIGGFIGGFVAYLVGYRQGWNHHGKRQSRLAARERWQ